MQLLSCSLIIALHISTIVVANDSTQTNGIISSSVPVTATRTSTNLVASKDLSTTARTMNLLAVDNVADVGTGAAAAAAAALHLDVDNDNEDTAADEHALPRTRRQLFYGYPYGGIYGTRFYGGYYPYYTPYIYPRYYYGGIYSPYPRYYYG